jgi:hypothetical protein
MRLPLNTRPCRRKICLGQARIDIGLRRARAHDVVDAPVDTVAGDLVSWPEGVGVVGERARGDAPVGPGAVAAEAVGCVEEDGGAEGTCVELFVPVSDWEVSV